ncbi:DsbE family thiol:disulfide interchange protein [Chelativorans salis]|uniref:DsbE family thiol:disulfide interchange protein n=1 Tax=Chelativorans salis TaxID=2978478 RepID=A0ABT2LSB0_9HYPH|nr:DsbE family thiol:disulfide interchange protein [Chelativorans sp. EGI FJ00035]MCT7376513.1 DsbE family thiol:disulfide interchange protein [Chelativorans sp. EGI FJ00035]
MTTDQERAQKPRRLILFLLLLPLVVFLALSAVFLMQLFSGRDTSVVPSALIGQPAPRTELPPLEGMDLPGLSPGDFQGNVTLVNVWGSWCLPCRDEHPFLMQLGEDERIRLVGLNYKDRPENARRFLGELGNPFDAIGVDQSGRAAIEWGVYGVPETFLVGPDGTIRYKHVGPFTPRSLKNDLMPEVEKALAEMAG